MTLHYQEGSNLFVFAFQDDASALDIPTMKRWNLIFRVFTAEYLRLSPSTEPNSAVVVGRTSEEFVSH